MLSSFRTNVLFYLLRLNFTIKASNTRRTIINKNPGIVNLRWIATLGFVFFYSLSLQAQKHYFQADSLNAIQILEALEEKLEVTFNYSHEYLPEGHFTYSCNGTKQQVIKITFSVLNRTYGQLDPGVYTIQPIELDESIKAKPKIINGQIIDEFGNPLIGATIGINNMNKVTITKENGLFYMKGFFASSEILEFRHLGYKPMVIRIGDFEKLEKRIIILEVQTHQLRDVEIMDNPLWMTQDFSNVDVVRTEKMPPAAGRTDKDPFVAVQLLPGVSTASENVSELQIRGGLPDQTKYEWNGIQVFQTSHFFGKISSTNPFMVDQIQVNRNGASAKDAGQASGTIALSDNPKVDSITIRAYADLLYANLGVKAPLFDDKLRVSAALRQSYIGALQSRIFDKFFDQTFQFGRVADEEYFLDKFNVQEFVSLIPDVRFRDFSLSTTWDASPKDAFQFNLISFQNRFTYRKETDGSTIIPTDTLHLRNSGLNANYSRIWSDQFKSEVSWSNSNYVNDYHYLEEIDTAAQNFEEIQFNKIDQSALRINNHLNYNKFDVSFGYQLERWEFESFHRYIEDTAINNFYDDAAKAREHSFYAQTFLRTSSIWQAELGLRWSKYSRTDRSLLEPRLHLSFFPSPQWTIHAHYGRFHQNLNQINVFTSLSIEGRYWYLSSEENPVFNETPIVQNSQLSIGSRYSKDNWSLSVDVYRKQIEGANTNAFDFTFEENPYRLAEMDIFGIETSFQYRTNWMTLFWTYEYVNDDFYIPDFDKEYPSPYTQPHRISLSQSFNYKKFRASLLWRFASGRPFSVPEELQTYIDNEGVVRYRLFYDELLTEKETNYHTLDLTLQYELDFPKNDNLKGTIGFSIINLYNRRNIVKNLYQIDYREEPFRPILQARRGLPFTPNLSFSLTFGVPKRNK